MHDTDPFISQTIDFVKDKLSGFDAGHDWWHIQRVYQNALFINTYEFGNKTIIQLGALLHDVADAKFYHGDETIGPCIAKEYLEKNKLDSLIIHHVVKIIENISFKNSFESTSYQSKELDIVQDADRLDAIGAIGIARAFTYGGFKNRELYNPEIPPLTKLTKEEYKKSTAPTINHFYEKLLLLKDKMRTKTGKRMAEDRHVFMEKYLEQFYKEWNCNH